MIDPQSLPPNLRAAAARSPALRQPGPSKPLMNALNVLLNLDTNAKSPDSCAPLPPSKPSEPEKAAMAFKPVSAGISVKPLKKRRQMNKTERRFADMLEARKRSGEFLTWRWEGMRLKWGGEMHYLPDFVVFPPNDRPTLYEVKGAHIRDRDIVRFKGCREEWPEFSFELWQWKDGKWTQKY